MDNQRAKNLRDGVRAFVAMHVQFFVGLLYGMGLLTGLLLGLALMPVLVGFGILWLTLLFTRWAAVFDRGLNVLLLGADAEPVPVDVTHGFYDMGSWTVAALRSGGTWRRVLYMGLKFPLGWVAITLVWMLAPWYFLELLGNAVGMNTGMLTGRLMWWSAYASSGLYLLPGGQSSRQRVAGAAAWRDDPFYQPDDVHLAEPLPDKPKRRLDLSDETGTDYYLTDDGEIREVKRKR